MKFCRQRYVLAAATVVLAGLISSCRTPQPKPEPAAPPAPEIPTPVVPLGPGRVFQIVTADSELRILVYRSGKLAKLGHNHVIRSHDLSGVVTLPEDPTQARFEIRMPVAPLAIDEPESRAGEGPDFATPVDDNVRVGTHRNMMKPQVLDGDQFPAVTVRSESIKAGNTENDFDVTFAVELRGQTHEMTAPVQVEVQGDALSARGEMTLKQTDLGLTPFTAAMGALAIKDELRIKFDIHAAVSVQ
ncbi:MAG: YceI family protein [Steroidobacteraceae bacterium]